MQIIKVVKVNYIFPMDNNSKVISKTTQLMEKAHFWLLTNIKNIRIFVVYGKTTS